jgi:hypothetical protein
MTPIQILLTIVLAAFSFETAWVLSHYGIAGFVREVFSSPAAGLAVLDLTIALSLVAVWMWRDARERGASFWPFAMLTVFFGSVGPLLYLIRREGAKRALAAGGRARAPQTA